MKRRPVAPRFDGVAETVQRLAVLLAAGVAPLSAWRHAAAQNPAGVARSVAATELASDLPHAIRSSAYREPAEGVAWRAVAAAWSVAGEVGAPLAPTLARLAEVLRSLAQAEREVELALAGPQATARIVVALPPLGLLVGVALGVDAPAVLLTTPVGLGCLAVGLTLLAGARRWSRRMVAAARDSDPTPGLGFELLAIGLSGGGTPDRAVDLVSSALLAAELPPLDDRASAILGFAASAGVPAASLFRAEAEEQRRTASAEARRRSVLLGTRLLLPLGLCVLPAFVLLGVVPVLIAIVSTTVRGW